MAQITFKGNPVQTIGNLPQAGASAPEFSLTSTTLEDINISAFKGKKVVLNIFPSIDTPVCAMSVRKFNEEASKLDNTVVLCISKDLPFAHARFCGAEGLEDVKGLSLMKSDQFGKDYGVTMTDGPLAGLLARSVVIADEEGKVIYTELVPEIAQEPDYDKALAALK